MEYYHTAVKRSFFFEYYGIGKTDELDEEESGVGAMEGGKTFPANIAMLRVKLGLSDKEIMERPWILTQIESCDFPNWSPKKKRIITSKAEADKYLDKYM